MIDFFLPMIPPTVTAQEQKTGVRNGKPYRYDPPELKAARVKLRDAVARFRPETPISGPVSLLVTWYFPANGRHRNREPKITRPDTDNLQKLLKDVMTEAGFWKDDAQVYEEYIKKLWGLVPGLYIVIQTEDDLDNERTEEDI